MKRIHFRSRRPQFQVKEEIYPINEKIKVPQVRVIDEKGEMLGVLDTIKAINLAKERGYDLIAVSPKADPPVAKFLHYGSFKYQREKAVRKQKAQQKKTDIKEIRLSPRIGKHDLDIRVNQAEKFLKRGDKVIISVQLKGREKQHPELARDIIVNFVKDIGQITNIAVEQEPKRQGGNFTAIIMPGGQPKLDENKTIS